MKKSTVEKLNKAIDVTGDLIPVDINKKEKVSVKSEASDLAADYTFSREQYHSLIDKGNEALEELLAVAKESESARAYEVTAQLVRTLSDTTKELLELQKSKKEQKNFKICYIARKNKMPRPENFKQQFDADSEALSLSWKDELIVIVLLFPIQVTFISTFFTEETMKDAWTNLGLMPDWYQTILMVVTLVVFGLKALVFRIAEKLFHK